MKLRLAVAGLLLVAASAATAVAAEQGPYFGVQAGVSQFHDADVTTAGYAVEASYDAGAVLGASIGYDFGGFRLEGEYAHRSADVDKIEAFGESVSVEDTTVKVDSFMVNALVDTTPKAQVSPFFGAGLGFLSGDIEGIEDTQLGYQLIAGVGVKATETMAFDLSYRFQGSFSDFEGEEAGDELSYTSSTLLAGLRVKF